MKAQWVACRGEQRDAKLSPGKVNETKSLVSGHCTLSGKNALKCNLIKMENGHTMLKFLRIKTIF